MTTPHSSPDPLVSRRRLWVLPPLLMVAIAVGQQGLARWENLTAWKGGGFGMFSTVDSASARFLRVTLTLPDGEVRVPVPGRLAPLARRLRAIPDREVLDTLARELARTTWVPRDYGSVAADGRVSYLDGEPAATSAPPPRRALRAKRDEEPAPRRSIVVNSVTVELWRYGFDRQRGLLLATRFDQSTGHVPSAVATTRKGS